MNCESTIDLLPWFANGTLDAAEKASVEAHLAACPGCREALEQTVELGMAAAQHIPIEMLLDFAEGRAVSDADIRQIEVHLATCSTCEREVEAARDHLPREPIPFPAPAESSRSNGLLAAAAILALAAGLGWIWSQYQLSQVKNEAAFIAAEGRALRQERDRLAEHRDTLLQQLDTTRDALTQLGEEAEDPNARPRPVLDRPVLDGPFLNAPVLEIVPDVVLRSGEENPDFTVSRGDAPFITLILISDSVPPQGVNLHLKIRASNGVTVWQGKGLRRSATGTYSILLPSERFPPDDYRTVVFHLAHDDFEVVVEEFQFRVKR